MFRRLACLLLTFLAASAAAAATCSGGDLRPRFSEAETRELRERLADYPHAEGLHWVASRGGQTIHVVGTVHISDPRLDPVVDRLAPIVRQADRLLVEATREDEAKLRDLMLDQPGRVFIMDGPTLPDLLPEPLWQRLRAASIARGYPGFMAAKTQPWFLSVMLAIPACTTQEVMAGANGLDRRLTDMAEAAQVPVLSLEPHDTIFRLMGTDPLERQIEMLSLGLLPEPALEDVTATLLASYFDERTAEVLEVSRLVAYRHVDLPRAEIDALIDEMLERLLDARNRAWMDRILAVPDGVTVVAVGAGHLPGRLGLLRLLEEEGFALERQPF